MSLPVLTLQEVSHGTGWMICEMISASWCCSGKALMSQHPLSCPGMLGNVMLYSDVLCCAVLGSVMYMIAFGSYCCEG